MKTIISSAIISSLLAIAVYAGESPLPRVTVYGTATTEVVPDQMVWSLRVENRGPALGAAAREHTDSVQKVLEFLKQSKADKALQTSRMEFSEVWEYRSTSRVRDGYVASTEISFKLTELERYTQLWLGLADMPAVSVRSITYDHTNRIEFQNQTREKAIVAAKEKAIASAHALGAEIGDPLLLEEDLLPSEGWQMNYGNSFANNVNSLAAPAGEGRGSPEALAPGTIPIRIRVKASFQLTVPHK